MPPRPHHPHGPDDHPPPPHGRHHPPHHHGHRILDALDLLVRRNLIRSLQELANAAEQELEAELAQFIRDRAEEEDNPALILAAARGQMDLLADRQHRRLLTAISDSRLGLIAPLPPHIVEKFADLRDVVVLIPDGHELPHHLHRRKLNAVQGTRRSRQAASDLDAIVFEAFRYNGHWQIDPDVMDVVDLRVVKPEVLRIIHIRPHAHPGDENIPLNAFTRVTLL